MSEWTEERIKEAQSKGVWTLIPAIYGPEGLELNEIDDKEWYDKLKAEIIEEGDRSIYAEGFVLGLVVQYDTPMVVSPLTGGDKALRHFFDLGTKLADARQSSIKSLELVSKYSADLTASKELIQDYEECMADKRRLTKEISDILHPKGNGPKRPALCDVLAYVRNDFTASKERVAKLEGDIIRFNNICVKKTRAEYKRIVELRGALEKYGRHGADCITWDKCTCGLEQVLKASAHAS